MLKTCRIVFFFSKREGEEVITTYLWGERFGICSIEQSNTLYAEHINLP